jgi:hypothetical protein
LIFAFPINTLTAQSGGHNLMLALPSKFAQLLLILPLNFNVLVTGENYLKIENDSTKARLSLD